MLYQPDAPGDWGQMLESDTVKTATDILNTSDGMAWVHIAAGLSIWATNWQLAV